MTRPASGPPSGPSSGPSSGKPSGISDRHAPARRAPLEEEEARAELSLWTPAYVALGSNLEDPPRQLRSARDALAALPASRLMAVSSFYRNPPLGIAEQPDFVNAVAALLTRLGPHELLAALKGIEAAHGRDRTKGDRWGPRILDLDLLLHGRTRCATDGLTLPHPGIAERNFVLFPLLEIAPGLELPGSGPVANLAARLDRSALIRVD